MHFIINCFSQRKRNYGIFNKDLLMTKAAFQYGRHFLDGINQFRYIWQIWKTYRKHNPSSLQDRVDSFFSISNVISLIFLDLKKQITKILSQKSEYDLSCSTLDHNLEAKHPFPEYISSGKDYGEGNRQYICWISLFATIRFIYHIDNLQRTTNWFVLCDLCKLFHKHHVLLPSRTTLPWQSNCWSIGKCLKFSLGAQCSDAEEWEQISRNMSHPIMSVVRPRLPLYSQPIYFSHLLPYMDLGILFQWIMLFTFLLNRVTQLFWWQ